MMFDVNDLKDLFYKLAQVAADKDKPLNSAAALLSKQYLLYLSKKVDDLDNNKIKPNYFTEILKNFFDEPGFDSKKIRAIYDDLRQTQSQHKLLLEADPDLPERLKTGWDEWIVTQTPAQNALAPAKMQSGHETGGKSTKREIVPETISIDALFQGDLNAKKNVLTIMSYMSELYVGDVFEQHGFEIICDLIKNSEDDPELKELAIKALANLGRYFFGKQAFIEDNMLQQILIHDLTNEKNEIKRTEILRSLGYCHPNYFTQDNLPLLISVLLANHTTWEQRYYVFNCLTPLFYLETFADQIGGYIIPITELLTLENAEKSRREAPYVLSLKANIVILLLNFSTDDRLASYLQGEECINRLIKLSVYNYNESEEVIGRRLLTIISIMMSSKKLGCKKVVSNPFNLNLLLDLLLRSTQDEILSQLASVLAKIDFDSNTSSLFFKKGVTQYLLNLGSSQALLSNRTRALIYCLLASSCADPNNTALCVKEGLYYDLLIFVESMYLYDAPFEKEIGLLSLTILLESAHPELSQDQKTMHSVVINLDMMHEKIRTNLLGYLKFAMGDNPQGIKPRSKEILTSITPLLKTDKTNRAAILYIIKSLLTSNKPLIHDLVALDLYQHIKGLLYINDIEIVRATVILIANIISHPDIEEDLLSSGGLVLKLHQLSCESSDEDTRKYADYVFTRRDIEEAKRLENDGRFVEAKSLLETILKRDNFTVVNETVLQGIAIIDQKIKDSGNSPGPSF